MHACFLERWVGFSGATICEETHLQVPQACPQYLLSPSRSTCPLILKGIPFSFSTFNFICVFSKISSFYPPVRDSIPLFCDSFNPTRFWLWHVVFIWADLLPLLRLFAASVDITTMTSLLILIWIFQCTRMLGVRAFIIVFIRRMFLSWVCIKICSLADIVKLGADFMLTRCLRKCIYVNYV